MTIKIRPHASDGYCPCNCFRIRYGGNSGAIHLSQTGCPCFFQSQQTFGGGHEYSDVTAAQLDREIKSILDQREKHVMDLLTSRKETMVQIAEKLLEK